MMYPDRKRIVDEFFDVLMTNINKRVLDTSEFNHMVNEWNPSWSALLRRAKNEPAVALKVLREDLIRFFERYDVSVDTMAEWVVTAVASTEEFKSLLDDGANWHDVLNDAMEEKTND